MDAGVVKQSVGYLNLCQHNRTSVYFYHKKMGLLPDLILKIMKISIYIYIKDI